MVAAPQVYSSDTPGDKVQPPPFASPPSPLTQTAQVQPPGVAAPWGDSPCWGAVRLSAHPWSKQGTGGSPLSDQLCGQEEAEPPKSRCCQLQRHHFPEAAPPLTRFRVPKAAVKAADNSARVFEL